MHWALVAAAIALAILCYQFGAMAVWISVLSLSLKAILFVVALVAVGAVVTFLWRRFNRSSEM